MPKHLKIAIPTDEEDAAITAAALADQDNPPLTDEQLARMRPASEAAPEIVAEYRRSRGRPPKEETKHALNIRLDREIVEAFKSTGNGWQTRINEALKEWLKTHTPA